MKTAIKALTVAALLIPASVFARDYDRWRPARSRLVENFERDHPRWPRVYCHTHRHPLRRDDNREHCHNWNRNSWEAARQWWSRGGWYVNDRRDDRWRWDRYDRDRRDHWRDRYR